MYHKLSKPNNPQTIITNHLPSVAAANEKVKPLPEANADHSLGLISLAPMASIHKYHKPIA
jgi:hypothetical protein